MSYRLSIPRSVNKRMERLPVEVYDRVDKAILSLADDPVRRVARSSEVARTGV